MVQLINEKRTISKGLVIENRAGSKKDTISYKILNEHNISNEDENLQIKFDAMASHDITYVGIIQTARASGLKKFPIPYALTNCHNSLCAVGGTINEDDHQFGLSAAKKYGGLFVPPHQAVIHQFNREVLSKCGSMFLGSDSHTRYGALGTMAIGEGGPELVKQLLGRTYDVSNPDIVGIYLTGIPNPGIGPMDIALSIIGSVFDKGFVKNSIMEFVGPGIENLSADYRNGIDVMTTETTCLSSIWMTDETIHEYYKNVGRPEDYSELTPGENAEYDRVVIIELDKVVPMIALPFHPSNVFTVKEVAENPRPFLESVEKYSIEKLGYKKGDLNLLPKIKNGKLLVDQGVIAGCAGGTFENISIAAEIMENKSIGSDAFTLSVYPSSQPVYTNLIENGSISKLMKTGSIIRSAFCGPCFGAGDTPQNNGFSIRHTTRNFPNREGSKPGDNQVSAVALMDARSIAATALNSGFLTPANEVVNSTQEYNYNFDKTIYKNRVYNGFNQAKPEEDLIYGPNIKDWPNMISLTDDLLLNVSSYITDPVTTTDELIPSGETSSYRSNPLRLAEFTLSRKDPEYVTRAKTTNELEKIRQNWLKNKCSESESDELFNWIAQNYKECSNIEGLLKSCSIGSVIYAVKPGDGSAREQAASCQKVLGSWANIAQDYATKRYRSNVINWGMVPFTISNEDSNKFKVNDIIHIIGLKQAIVDGKESITAKICGKGEITLKLENFTEAERAIVLQGSLINFYSSENN